MTRWGAARAQRPGTVGAGAWRGRIDWGRLGPLRLRARLVAEGVFAGAHRSTRRGPGVEFGGHRPYVPGDDLRWIDKHALMRHDKLIVREFETETDRGLHLVVDATASMAFRGSGAPGAKVAFAALVAAALGRVALTSGDPVSLFWIGGDATRALAPTSAGDAFERLVGALESARASGDAAREPDVHVRPLQAVARRARRGAVVVLISDLLDLPARALDDFAALGVHRRRLVAVQTLDPEELAFPFEGTVRLRALEGDASVQTDAGAARARYLASLESISSTWSARLAPRGGSLVRAPTDSDPVEVVRSIVRVVAEGPR